jgi:hypothetical protein
MLIPGFVKKISKPVHEQHLQAQPTRRSNHRSAIAREKNKCPRPFVPLLRN